MYLCVTILPYILFTAHIIIIVLFLFGGAAATIPLIYCGITLIFSAVVPNLFGTANSEIHWTFGGPLKIDVLGIIMNNESTDILYMHIQNL